MKQVYIFSFLFLLFLCPNIGKAQDEPLPVPVPAVDIPPAPKQYYVFSPRVSVTVPHPMANSSFKKCFVGIYEVSIGLNVMYYKGLFIGGTYKNGLLKITENKIADYNARMYLNNAAIKIGGDKYVGEKNQIIFSAAVAVGQNWTRYSDLKSKDPNKVIPLKFSMTYVEPEVNLFFLIESNFGIGATVSYSMFAKNFNPYELSLNDYTQFNPNANGATQYLSFGFGFYYSMLKKKQHVK